MWKASGLDAQEIKFSAQRIDFRTPFVAWLRVAKWGPPCASLAANWPVLHLRGGIYRQEAGLLVRRAQIHASVFPLPLAVSECRVPRPELNAGLPNPRCSSSLLLSRGFRTSDRATNRWRLVLGCRFASARAGRPDDRALADFPFLIRLRFTNAGLGQISVARRGGGTPSARRVCWSRYKASTPGYSPRHPTQSLVILSRMGADSWGARRIVTSRPLALSA
jgi:hypothetical protein